jgi:hypothetical protein
MKRNDVHRLLFCGIFLVFMLFIYFSCKGGLINKTTFMGRSDEKRPLHWTKPIHKKVLLNFYKVSNTLLPRSSPCSLLLVFDRTIG